MTHHRHTIRSMLTALLVLAGAACESSEPVLPDPNDPKQVRVVRQAAEGLTQIVRISPAEPSPGDTLRVVSVIHNSRSASATVAARICGLDLQGSLTLDDPFIRCGGYSIRRDLAAGDSLPEADRAIVASRAGSYTLRVRHLLEPEQWVSVPIRVR